MPREQALGGGEDRLRLAHAAGPLARPFGERSRLGTDELPATFPQRLDVRLRRGVRPHGVVHRGCAEHRPGAGEQQRREEVVGETHRGAREEVGRGRREDHEVRRLGEGDVGEGALGLPQRREHRSAGERLEHHGTHELGRGGGEQMAAELDVPFLGRVPIYQPIREGGDRGVPLMISEPESPAAQAFMVVAERTAAQLSIASYNRPNTIPLTIVR